MTRENEELRGLLGKASTLLYELSEKGLLTESQQEIANEIHAKVWHPLLGNLYDRLRDEYELVEKLKEIFAKHGLRVSPSDSEAVLPEDQEFSFFILIKKMIDAAKDEEERNLVKGDTASLKKFTDVAQNYPDIDLKSVIFNFSFKGNSHLPIKFQSNFVIDPLLEYILQAIPAKQIIASPENARGAKPKTDVQILRELKPFAEKLRTLGRKPKQIKLFLIDLLDVLEFNWGLNNKMYMIENHVLS